MAGFDKRVNSYAEALDGLENGMTVLAGGCRDHDAAYWHPGTG